MNKLKFLGRGSGFHKYENNTSAYLIKGETLLLIDCGETVFKKILRENLLEGIKEVHIPITHMHSDHVGSIGGFVGYCYLINKIVPKVYFNDKENLVDFLDFLGQKEDEHYIIEDAKNKRIDTLGLTLTALLTKHVKTMNSYSYKLEFDEGNDIFYSGDSCEINPNINSFLEKGNIVYHDTCLNDNEGNVHTSLRLLSETIPSKYRSQVYCMHIDGENFEQKAKEKGFNVIKEI